MKQPVSVTIIVKDADGMRMEVTHVQATNRQGDVTEASTVVVKRATHDANTWLRRQARLSARMPAKPTTIPQL